MKNRTQKIVAWMGLAVVLSPALYVWSYDLQSTQREAKALAKLAALGFDGSLQAHEKRKPADSENAAALLIEIQRDWDAKEIGGYTGPNSFGGVSASTKTYLRDNARLIDSLDRLRTRPRLWVKFDPKGFNQRSGFLAQCIFLSRVCTDSATLAAIEGRHDDARRHIAVVRHIAHLLADERSLVCLQEAIRLHGQTDLRVVSLMTRTSSPEDRDAWRKSLLAQPFIPNYSEVIPQELLYVRHRSLDDPIWGPRSKSFDGRLSETAIIRHRIRANQLESWVSLAELVQDGHLSTKEVETFKVVQLERTRNEPFAEDHVTGYSFISPLEPSRVAEQIVHEMVQSAAEYLVQKAGGPTASKGPKIKITDNFARITVQHEDSADLLSNSIHDVYRIEDYSKLTP